MIEKHANESSPESAAPKAENAPAFKAYESVRGAKRDEVIKFIEDGGVLEGTLSDKQAFKLTFSEDGTVKGEFDGQSYDGEWDVDDTGAIHITWKEYLLTEAAPLQGPFFIGKDISGGDEKDYELRGSSGEVLARLNETPPKATEEDED